MLDIELQIIQSNPKDYSYGKHKTMSGTYSCRLSAQTSFLLRNDSSHVATITILLEDEV